MNLILSLFGGCVFIKEKGLYQNILITGSIGSGKTSTAISNNLESFIKNNLGVMINDIKAKYVDTDIPNTLTEYYLSLHSSKFDEEQLGIFRVLKRRLKRAWYNLIGKDYLYMDIVMSEKEYKDFVKKLQDLQK